MSNTFALVLKKFECTDVLSFLYKTSDEMIVFCTRKNLQRFRKHSPSLTQNYNMLFSSIFHLKLRKNFALYSSDEIFFIRLKLAKILL